MTTMTTQPPRGRMSRLGHGFHVEESSRRNLFNTSRSSFEEARELPRQVASTAGNISCACSVTRPSTNSFYGRRTPLVDDSEDTWQPGQYLVPHVEPTQPDIHSLLAQMQSAISEQIQKVQMSVNALAGRMDQFEKDLTNTAEQVRFCQTPCSSVSPSSTDSDDTGKQRKRRISLDLSNTIRTIHNNLLEEKQLKTNETIDGPHNKIVLETIKKEVDDIGEECILQDVKCALAIYRLSLRRKSRDSIETNEKRLMRSRQQRKYDRRGRRVNEGEREKWKDLSPAVMSDEEDIGHNTFKIHRQEWRSPELDEFLEELDRRADAALKRAHPRKSRILGTPLKNCNKC